MKVIGIVEVPKNGNTNVLVQQVLTGAAEAGAETRTFILNEMNYRGCRAAITARTTKNASLKTTLWKYSMNLASADGVIFGSPIYFGQFTGQMRLFLDRCYSLITLTCLPASLPGKKP